MLSAHPLPSHAIDATPAGVEVAACPLCGADHPHLEQRVADLRHGLVRDRDVVRCLDCDMVYLRDRVPLRELGSCYPPNYITNQMQPIDPPPAGRLSLGDRIFNQSVWDREEKKVRGIEAAAAALGVELGRETRLLDVGTGPALFLELARRRWGCSVRGNDFSPLNADYARRRFEIEVDVCAFADVAYSSGVFDIVTMWHYLEHDYEPRAAVEHARDLLTSRGLLVIEVPNFDSFEARLFGRYWYNFDCPRHVQFFTPATIRRLLESSGFRVESITYPFQAIGWSGSLQHVLGVDLYADLRRNILPAAVAFAALMPLSLLGRLAARNDWMTIVASRA